jgi:hypothetical protein
MNKDILRSFDETIQVIRDAKDHYERQHYRESQKLLEKADREYRKNLLSGIDDEMFDVRRKRHGGCVELTEKEKEKLIALNEVLTALEKKIGRETQAIVTTCEERLNAPDEEFLKDFEIEVTIRFYDDAGTELAKLTEDGKMEYDGTNWNDVDHDVAPENRPYHCWLYHELYDHHVRPSLRCQDLSGIRTIRTDIDVIYQNVIKPEPHHTKGT